VNGVNIVVVFSFSYGTLVASLGSEVCGSDIVEVLMQLCKLTGSNKFWKSLVSHWATRFFTW